MLTRSPIFAVSFSITCCFSLVDHRFCLTLLTNRLRNPNLRESCCWSKTCLSARFPWPVAGCSASQVGNVVADYGCRFFVSVFTSYLPLSFPSWITWHMAQTSHCCWMRSMRIWGTALRSAEAVSKLFHGQRCQKSSRNRWSLGRKWSVLLCSSRRISIVFQFDPNMIYSPWMRTVSPGNRHPAHLLVSHNSCDSIFCLAWTVAWFLTSSFKGLNRPTLVVWRVNF